MVRVLGRESLILALLIAAALLGVAVIVLLLARARRAQADQLKVELKNEFERLAQDIFERTSQRFQTQNDAQLQTMLVPLREQLAGFQALLRDSSSARQSQHIDLKAELHHMRALNSQLGQDTAQLTRALRGDSKAQGNWGELQLERLLESAGLSRGVHFETQVSVASEDARFQPDVIVRLPLQRDVVIDAKVSLSAYARFCSGDSAALKDHLGSLRAHIQGLAARAYERLPGVRSLDFVLLYVPIEGALTDALRADPELADYALRRNIVLSSTTTLLLMLKTVASLWRIEQQNQNAEEIARQAGQLYDKFASLYGDLKRVEQQLNGTQQTFALVFNKLKDGQGSLVSRTENLKRLGAKTAKSLPAADEQGHQSDAQSL